MVQFTAAGHVASSNRTHEELTPAFLLEQGEPGIEAINNGVRIAIGDYAITVTGIYGGQFCLVVQQDGAELCTITEDPSDNGGGGSGSFVLILVLFILLVIIGAGFGDGHSHDALALLGEDGLFGDTILDTLTDLLNEDASPADVLFGNTGNDLFLYADGSGSDQNKDYSPGQNEGDWTDFGFASREEARGFAEVVDGKVVFDFGDRGVSTVSGSGALSIGDLDLAI